MKNGFNVWWDEGIDPGTEWDENIAYHVKECSYFVAFISKGYVESKNCKDELNYSRDLDKNQLLVYMEDVELPDGMAMRMNRIQSIFWYKYENEQDALNKLESAAGIQVTKLEKIEEPAVAELSQSVETEAKEVETIKPAYTEAAETAESSPVEEKVVKEDKTVNKKKAAIGVGIGAGIVAVIGVIVVAVIIIAAIIIAVVCSSGKGGFKSPEDAFYARMTGFAQGDIDENYKSYPDFLVEYNGGKKAQKESIEDAYESQIASKYDSSMKIEYTADNYKLLSDTELENLEERLQSLYDNDKIKIKKAATVDYTLTIYKDGQLYNSQSGFEGGYAVYYKNKWYYINMY